MKAVVQFGTLALDTYFCEWLVPVSVEGRIQQYSEGEACHHREGDHSSSHFRQEKNFTVEFTISFSSPSVRNPQQEGAVLFWR